MNVRLAKWFLRGGLAFVFLYAAVSSFLNPDLWLSFLPPFLLEHFSVGLLLGVFSAYQVVLALWLLWGKGLRYAALISATTLLLIIVFNFRALDVVFRDVAILAMALALGFL